MTPRTNPLQDPNRSREAEKYPHPIPSREFILQILAETGPLDFTNLIKSLKLKNKRDQESLSRRLKAMERDGQLVANRRGVYCLVNTRNLVAGRVIGHPEGFGFLKPDTTSDDITLSAREMKGLFHNDRIVVRITGQDRRGRLEGKVVEVLERNTKQVVGRLYQESGVGFLVPDNKRLHHDIIIPKDALGNATQGQIVVAQIIEQPTKRTQPIGRIIEILGEHMAAGMESDIAIRAFEIPIAWPEAVQEEIKDFASEVPEEAKLDREDLRTLPLITIDGADAKDFDDAVYCARTPKGWKLLVCIADVTAYVPPDSALDQEAYKRGTSVYFPDRVLPMLPEVLSNGLCSLNAHVDRLCITCELYINTEGKITRSRFFKALMRSQARLTYDQVAELLENPTDLDTKYAHILPQLKELYALYQVLSTARQLRGAIDFETIETQFRFDTQGKIAEIYPLIRNTAHHIIEECMLIANVAAARFLQRKRLPSLYRIHQGPKEEKIKDLRTVLGELGLSLTGGDKPEAKDYATLTAKIQQRPDKHLIQALMLRSLSQAVYSAENLGHFGLAYQTYTHFTSPIRRYPDLLVHRAIKHLLAGGTKDNFLYSLSKLQAIGEHCSTAERRADEASWDAIAWLKCEYMHGKIGDKYHGTISGVSSFGFFVDLDNIHVDGLVHVASLDNDYYHFDPVSHRLTGEHSGYTYRIGDRVEVIVANVNLDERKIDFQLIIKAATQITKTTKTTRVGNKNKGSKTKKRRR